MPDVMPDGKKEYLQMLQEPICRMSTISAIFKGLLLVFQRSPMSPQVYGF